MRAMGGILAISTDLSEAPSVAPPEHESSLRNIGVSIAAEMHAKREGRQAPGHIDLVKAQIDQIDELTEGIDEINEDMEYVSRLESMQAIEEEESDDDQEQGADDHLEVLDVHQPEEEAGITEPASPKSEAAKDAKKAPDGSSSFDSTMTHFLDEEASLASAAVPEVDSSS